MPRVRSQEKKGPLKKGGEMEMEMEMKRGKNRENLEKRLFRGGVAVVHVALDAPEILFCLVHWTLPWNLSADGVEVFNTV